MHGRDLSRGAISSLTNSPVVSPSHQSSVNDKHWSLHWWQSAARRHPLDTISRRRRCLSASIILPSNAFRLAIPARRPQAQSSSRFVPYAAPRLARMSNEAKQSEPHQATCRQGARISASSSICASLSDGITHPHLTSVRCVPDGCVTVEKGDSVHTSAKERR